MDLERDAITMKFKKYPSIECRYFESSTSRIVVNTVNPYNTVGSYRSRITKDYSKIGNNVEISDILDSGTKTPYSATANDLIRELIQDYKVNTEVNTNVFINEQNSDDETTIDTDKLSNRTISQNSFDISTKPFDSPDNTTSCSRSVPRTSFRKKGRTKKCNYNKRKHLSTNETFTLPAPNENQKAEKTTYCRQLNNMHNEEFFFKTMQRNARLQNIVKQLAIERKKEKQKESWNNYINELKNKHGHCNNDPARISQYAPNDRNSTGFIGDYYNMRPNGLNTEPTQNLIDDFYGSYSNIHPNDCDKYRPVNNNFMPQQNRAQYYGSNSYCYPTASQSSAMMRNGGKVPEHLKKYFSRTPIVIDRYPSPKRPRGFSSNINHSVNAYDMINAETNNNKQTKQISVQTDTNLQNLNNIIVVPREVSHEGTSTKHILAGINTKRFTKPCSTKCCRKRICNDYAKAVPINRTKINGKCGACHFLQDIDTHDLRQTIKECDCEAFKNKVISRVSRGTTIEPLEREFKEEYSSTDHVQNMNKTVETLNVVECRCKRLQIGDINDRIQQNVNCSCERLQNLNSNVAELPILDRCCKRLQRRDSTEVRLLQKNCSCERIINKYMNVAKQKTVDCACKRFQNLAGKEVECDCKCLCKIDNFEVDCACKHLQNISVECACKRSHYIDYKEVECTCKRPLNTDDKDVECACKIPQNVGDKEVDCPCKRAQKIADKEVECACKSLQTIDDIKVKCACKLPQNIGDKEVECACKRSQDIGHKDVECACKLSQNIGDKEVDCPCKRSQDIGHKDLECACKRSQDIGHKDVECACNLPQNIGDKEVDCPCKRAQKIADKEVECACKRSQDIGHNDVECACKLSQNIGDKEVDCPCKRSQDIADKDVECACKRSQNIGDKDVECACKLPQNIDHKEIQCACKHLRVIDSLGIECTRKCLQAIDTKGVECSCKLLQSIGNKEVDGACKRLKNIDIQVVDRSCKCTQIIKFSEVDCACKRPQNVKFSEVDCACKHPQNVEFSKVDCARKRIEKIKKFFAGLIELQCACKHLQAIEDNEVECASKDIEKIKEFFARLTELQCACKYLSVIEENEVESACERIQSIKKFFAKLTEIDCTCKRFPLIKDNEVDDDRKRLQYKDREPTLKLDCDCNFEQMQNEQDNEPMLQEEIGVSEPLQKIKENEARLKEFICPNTPLNNLELSRLARLKNGKCKQLHERQRDIKRSLQNEMSNVQIPSQISQCNVPKSKSIESTCKHLQDVESKIVTAVECTILLQNVEQKLDNLIASFNSFVKEMREMKCTECNRSKIKTPITVSVSDELNSPSKSAVIRTTSGTCRLQKTDQVLYTTVVRNKRRKDTIPDIDPNVIRLHRNFSNTKIENIIQEEMEKSKKIKRDIKELLHTGYDRECSVEISFDIPTKEVSTAVTSSSSRIQNDNGHEFDIEKINTPKRSKDRTGTRMAIAVNTDPLGLLALFRISAEAVKQLLSYMPQLNYYSYLRSIHSPHRPRAEHYVCNICGASFCRPSQLSDHIRQNHDLGRTRDCCVCRHVIDLRNDSIGLFKCKYCGKMFARAYCCELHQQTCAKLIGKKHDVTPNLMLLK